MNIDDETGIAKRLNRREVLGFNLTGYIPLLKLTVEPEQFGYIKIRRLYIAPVTPWDPETEREDYLRWIQQKAETERNPYHIHIAVVREKPEWKADFPNWDFPDNDDYLLKESYNVPTIAEVENIINRYSKSLSFVEALAGLRIP